MVRFQFGVVAAILWISALHADPVPSPASASSTDLAMARATARVERRPKDRDALLALGEALARKGRESGDAGHFERATQVLQTGVTLHPADSALWRHLSYVLSLRHDFHAAAEAAGRAVELAQEDPGAHGVLGDALLELGRYEEARTHYAVMAGLSEDLASLSRLSGMASLYGDADGAIVLLKRAIEAGRRDGEPAESVAWAQWQLGVEQLNRGRLKAARRAFEAALATYPDYHRALAGLGAVAASRGQHAAARRAYRRAMAVVPLPEYALGVAASHAAQGQGARARAQWTLIEQLTALGGGDYHRDVAHYLLDRGRQVERILAQSERALAQRPDIQGHQLHAWALYRSGRADEALQAIGRALRLGTRDARLLYQAGVIHLAAGESARGRAYLRDALRVNARFDTSLAAHARRLLKGRET